MLWDSIVRYITERGALGSKTGYRLKKSILCFFFSEMKKKLATQVWRRGAAGTRESVTPVSSRPGAPLAGLPKCVEGAGQKEVHVPCVRNSPMSIGSEQDGFRVSATPLKP
jgi:hypothetical protein